MFTGIIETLGTIASVREKAGAREFVIQAPEIAGEIGLGDSITVDGACQTATRFDAETFAIDTIGTTLSRTIAGGYRVGTRVNLEVDLLARSGPGVGSAATDLDGRERGRRARVPAAGDRGQAGSRRGRGGRRRGSGSGVRESCSSACSRWLV